ncbi:hypothetical protein C8F01DRAFT_1113034 [Mycena amicta]|nr:hypothetical protein C8F01DRAFT_1113034 [Mycena amicta]
MSTQLPSNPNTTVPVTQEPAPMTAAQAQPHDNKKPPVATQAQMEGHPPIVPFKERVIGVAKKTRGTLLSKPELKEHGEKILQGEASVYDIHEPPARTA